MKETTSSCFGTHEGENESRKRRLGSLTTPSVSDGVVAVLFALNLCRLLPVNPQAAASLTQLISMLLLLPRPISTGVSSAGPASPPAPLQQPAAPSSSSSGRPPSARTSVDGIGKETPLISAAVAGSTDILKGLVLAGADANVTVSVLRLYHIEGNWEMSKHANMFLLLYLDGEDDGENGTEATQTSSTSLEEIAASKPVSIDSLSSGGVKPKNVHTDHVYASCGRLISADFGVWYWEFFCSAVHNLKISLL